MSPKNTALVSHTENEGSREVWPNITSVTGGGKPFDIMPPFVALYYCIKE